MSVKRKVLVILGTRPEAVKLAPLVAEMRSRAEQFEVVVVSTGQHRELLAGALEAFDLRPDLDLDLMEPDQRLGDLLGRILTGLGPVLAEQAPDVVVVQGDTSTALGGCLAASYAKVPVAHVEAGLRSGNLLAPFPEEQHRVLIDRLARWHFAPTQDARANLLREGFPSDQIWVTGNTGVDALAYLRRKSLEPAAQAKLAARLAPFRAGKLLLATIHRREHGEQELRGIAAALAELAEGTGLDVVLPLHPNPTVTRVLRDALADSRVHCVPVFDPVSFVGLLGRAACVLTDSGGVQEEAATLGVPTILARRRSDRPESVQAGVCRVVGPETRPLVRAIHQLLDVPGTAQVPCHVYGDGRACARIVDVLGIDD